MGLSFVPRVLRCLAFLCVSSPVVCLPYHTSGPTIAGIFQLTQQLTRYHSCLILWLYGHAALRRLVFHKLIFHVVFMFSCGDGKVVSACAINFGQVFLVGDRVRLAPARGIGALCSLCLVISIVNTAAV